MTNEHADPATARSKQLFILRHAKSSWPEPGLSDFERPLNARGRAAAAQVGAHLARSLEAPLDCVMVSSAQRTRQTWELLGLGDTLERPPLLLDRLYDASATTIAQAIADYVWPKARRVLVIGHNSGLEDFCLQAVATSQDPQQAPQIAQMQQKFPTAGLASFALSASWQALASRAGLRPGLLRLEAFVTPRMLAKTESA